MSEGCVYVLFNPSFLDLVKVGRTGRPSEERAREISSGTGVPTPYIVAYEAFSADCETLEAEVHSALKPYRVSRDREFFRIPLKEAVATVQLIASQQPGSTTAAEVPERIAELEISTELRAKYSSHVRPDISSARIVQTDQVCYLVVTSRPYPHALDELIQKTDLGFFMGADDRPMFLPSRSVEDNAHTFLADLDPYDLIMCTNLFTREAATEIAQRFESTDSSNPIAPAGPAAQSQGN